MATTHLTPIDEIDAHLTKLIGWGQFRLVQTYVRDLVRVHRDEIDRLKATLAQHQAAVDIGTVGEVLSALKPLRHTGREELDAIVDRVNTLTEAMCR
jgi:hypothetical protein